MNSSRQLSNDVTQDPYYERAYKRCQNYKNKVANSAFYIDDKPLYNHYLSTFLNFSDNLPTLQAC